MALAVARSTKRKKVNGVYSGTLHSVGGASSAVGGAVVGGGTPAVDAVFRGSPNVYFNKTARGAKARGVNRDSRGRFR